MKVFECLKPATLAVLRKQYGEIDASAQAQVRKQAEIDAAYRRRDIQEQYNLGCASEKERASEGYRAEARARKMKGYDPAEPQAIREAAEYIVIGRVGPRHEILGVDIPININRR